MDEACRVGAGSLGYGASPFATAHIAFPPWGFVSRATTSNDDFPLFDFVLQLLGELRKSPQELSNVILAAVRAGLICHYSFTLLPPLKE